MELHSSLTDFEVGMPEPPRAKPIQVCDKIKKIVSDEAKIIQTNPKQFSLIVLLWTSIGTAITSCLGACFITCHARFLKYFISYHMTVAYNTVSDQLGVVPKVGDPEGGDCCMGLIPDVTCCFCCDTWSFGNTSGGVQQPAIFGWRAATESDLTSFNTTWKQLKINQYEQYGYDDGLCCCAPWNYYDETPCCSSTQMHDCCCGLINSTPLFVTQVSAIIGLVLFFIIGVYVALKSIKQFININNTSNNASGSIIDIEEKDTLSM